MEFGISTHLFVYEKLSFPQLQLIAEAGLSHIELWCMNPHFPFHSWEEVKKLHSCIKKLEINISSIHSPFYRNFEELNLGRTLQLTDKDSSWRKIAIEEIKESFKVASDLGAPYAVVHAGKKEDPGEDSEQKLLIRSIEELLPAAERANIVIALENIDNDLSNSPLLYSLIKQFSSDHLAVCFDTGHAYLCELPGDAITTLGPYLKTTHIHDNHGERDEHLFPFEGSIDWKEISEKMEEIDYKGLWVFEPRKYDYSYEEHMEKMKSSMAKLHRLKE